MGWSEKKTKTFFKMPKEMIIVLLRCLSLYLCIMLLLSVCTSGVQVCVAGSVARAEAGGARVTVLGFGGANGQAANLTVCTVHHLHELTTPGGQGIPVLGLHAGKLNHTLLT